MSPKLLLYLVAFAAFLGPFTQTIYVPMLPEAVDIFHTTSFLVNLSVSLYTFCLAFMQLVYGPLVDEQGRKKILISGLLLYLAASVGCYFASNITIFLLFRGLQAVGIAAGSVVATTVIADIFTGPARGRAMGLFQMAVALGPVLGPLIGGFIGGNFGISGISFVVTIVGLCIMLANLTLLPETKPEQAEAGQRFSPRQFVLVLRHPIGLGVIMLGFMQFYALYHFLVFLPTIFQQTYQYGPSSKAWMFLPLSAGLVVGSYLGGRLQERFSLTRTLLSSSSGATISILFFFTTFHLSVVFFMVTLACFGFCLGVSMPQQTTLLTNYFKENRATAVGLFNVFRFIGAGISPIIGSFLFHVGGVTLLYVSASLLYFFTVLWSYYLFRNGAKQVSPV